MKPTTSNQSTFSKDPGLQPERTQLSWFRTLLLLLGAGALVLRLGWKAQDYLLGLSGVSLITTACVIYVVIARPLPIYPAQQQTPVRHLSTALKRWVSAVITVSGIVCSLYFLTELGYLMIDRCNQ
uniref:DUF202 domain-containing protein n=1 Tax=Thaumasiovibrio occultus TaxID=1891184 RepID=UPI000B355424|nr:DUF202 domain-containing protein [Thaumasiovibrio occultus]